MKIHEGVVVGSNRSDEFGTRSRHNITCGTLTGLLRAAGFTLPQCRLQEKPAHPHLGLMHHNHDIIYYDIRNPKLIVDIRTSTREVIRSSNAVPIPVDVKLMPVVMRNAGIDTDHLHPDNADIPAVITQVLSGLGYSQEQSYDPVKPDLYMMTVDTWYGKFDVRVSIKKSTGCWTEFEYVPHEPVYYTDPHLVSHATMVHNAAVSVICNMGWILGNRSECARPYTVVVCGQAIRVNVNMEMGVFHIAGPADDSSFTLPRFEGYRLGEVVPFHVELERQLARQFPEACEMVKKTICFGYEDPRESDLDADEVKYVGPIDWNSMTIEQRSIYLLGVKHGQKAQ